ncbi:hypothetical protein AAC387_Pa05g1048 [Persea americana]
METQNATLSKEKCSVTLGQVRSSPSKFSSRYINCKSRAIRRCTSKGHLLTQKMSLCLLKIKSYMEPHPTTNRQSCFKHQNFSESNKNCKIPQNSQKKGTHEVSGYFNIVCPNFNPPTVEHELPETVVLKTTNLRSEPMDGLKIPPKGSMPNFKSNRHHLTLHQLWNGEIKPLGGENLRCLHSSNKAHG